HRQLAGDAVDWEEEFARPLRQGVDTFRAYVEAWYDGRFQDVVFYQDPPPGLRAMICSVLAGYAWDRSNPFAADAARLVSVWERIDPCATLRTRPILPGETMPPVLPSHGNAAPSLPAFLR
ncbi:MAG: hypothetical protein ACO3IC_10100, partial [Burkholderiaceae bacterium]